MFGSSSLSAASLDLATLDGTNGFAANPGAITSGAGDVNGDGLDDLIIAGSYVVFGNNTSSAASLDLTTLDGTNGFSIQNNNSYAGTSVSGAGDFNGDGIDDLILGAPCLLYTSPSPRDRG